MGTRERPIRAALYVSLLGGAWGCYRSNPGPASLQGRLLEASNALLLLSPWVRSGAADGHVRGLLRLQDEGRLRTLSLGLVTVAYSAPFDPDSCLYEARCPPLRPRWIALPDRLLDLGCLGRWWVLERKLRDFDVNEDEFRHLPPALRALPPAALHSERNEQLHREARHPIELGPEDVARAEREQQRESGGAAARPLP
ncbi:TIM29 translocase, partial [Amia calva]|nr:TIM29 translocase [Amia calva]